MFQVINRTAAAILFDTFTSGYPLDQAIRFHFKALGKGLGNENKEKILFRVNTVCHHLRTLCAATGIQEPADLRHWAELLHAARVMKAANPDEKDLPLKRKIQKISTVPALGLGWTDEIYQLGATEWGAASFAEISSSLMKPAPVFIRVNLLKTNPEDLMTELSRSGFLPERTAEGAVLRIRQPAGIFKSSAFSSGFFEVQDISSYRVAKFCGVSPGQRVADACAGAGGKSLALAADMQGKGRIVAFDISEKKLEELKRRARRAGAGIIETRAPEKSKDRSQASFDVVLVDAPCSGSGVLRRNPDARWRMDVTEIQRLCALQKELLFKASKMVRPGGSLVFATCSIFKCEGEEVITDFLNRRQDFSVEKETRLMPGEDDGDGFYMVRFRNSGEAAGAKDSE